MSNVLSTQINSSLKYMVLTLSIHNSLATRKYTEIWKFEKLDINENNFPLVVSSVKSEKNIVRQWKRLSSHNIL